jgi:hypothetical protein
MRNDSAVEADFLARLRARLGGAHRDESGQSIVYIALILFLLACFTFMVINSGALLHDKIQVQSASDASVLSGSTWIVRAMNLNSMMNIFQAMLLAEEIYMKAVFWTALTALLLSPAIEAFWAAVCVITGTCSPAIDVIFDTFELYPILWETEDDEDFIWDIMETLSDVEQGVDSSFPWVAELESVRVAMMDGAAFGIMYPPSIPEEQGELQDLCSTTLSGAEGGYNEVQYSAFGSLTTAINEISGFSYAGDLRNIAGDLVSAIGLGGPLWGELQIPYHAFWASKAPYHFTNIMFILAVWARYAVMCGGSFGPSSVHFEVEPAWWCFFCDEEGINIPNPFYYLGSLFSFLDSGNSEVQPFMLAEDWEDRRNYYGFAYKTPDDVAARFIPAVFQNTYGDTVGMVTVAQAQIYNPHEDGGLFSPHWRTHLSPVTLTSDLANSASSAILGSPAGSEAAPGGLSGMVASLAQFAGGAITDVMAH